MKPTFHQPAPFALLPHAFAAFAADPGAMPADALRNMDTHADSWDDYCRGRADKVKGLQIDAVTGIAVQPVSGVMMAGVDPEYEIWCGYFNTERIVEACSRAASDESIKALVLQINSPGGYTAGVREAAAAIAELRAARPGMPVVAYAERVCASAALWVALACGERAAAPGAEVGGIGVYQVTMDSSKYFLQAGIEVKLFTDGKFKGLGAAGVAWSDAWYGHVAERVANMSRQFKSLVGLAAPAHPAALMEGQSWSAADGPTGEGYLFAGTVARFGVLLESVNLYLQSQQQQASRAA